MIIRLCRVSAFCVRVVSVAPIIFRKCRINFSTKILVNRGLFLKSFVRTFHAQISAYACLVNEPQYFQPFFKYIFYIKIWHAASNNGINLIKIIVINNRNYNLKGIIDNYDFLS